ncbi:MAG TPA: hypothetical protein PK560_03840 [bacterium]|nr:hypothetical protein [bacterium]
MEQEGDLGDVVYGEYHQLNLSSAPRITTTYTHKDALKKLSAGKFDMIIIMVGIDFQELKQLSLNIKELDLGIPATFYSTTIPFMPLSVKRTTRLTMPIRHLSGTGIPPFFLQ